MGQTDSAGYPITGSDTKDVCMYCSEVIEDGDLTISHIFSPNWKPSYKSPPRKYHKEKGCAGYDQMAHEG